MRDFDVLIFDWDGTLANSCEHIAESLQAAAQDMDMPVSGKDKIKDLIGCGMFEVISSLYPTLNEKERARLVERYRQHFFAGEHHVALYPGVKETLIELDAAGYLLAIATSEARARLDRALEDFGLKSMISATRCGDETFSKPNPQMIFDILESLGSDAHRALMIGDTEYDMQMALNANVKSIAVACGVHDTDRLTRCRPLTLLHSVVELPIWLNNPLR